MSGAGKNVSARPSGPMLEPEVYGAKHKKALTRQRELRTIREDKKKKQIIADYVQSTIPTDVIALADQSIGLAYDKAREITRSPHRHTEETVLEACSANLEEVHSLERQRDILLKQVNYALLHIRSRVRVHMSDDKRS